jgi:hypothetical protein
MAKLGEGVAVAVRIKSVGGRGWFDGFAATPASELSAAIKQDILETEHVGVVDLDNGDFAASRGNG